MVDSFRETGYNGDTQDGKETVPCPAYSVSREIPRRGSLPSPKRLREAMATENTNQQPAVRYRTNPNFLMREIGGESVLVPVGDAGRFENSVLSLNRTCSFLWKVFEAPHTIQEAVDAAKECFSAPDGEMERDIIAFVTQSVELQLLQEE